MKQILVCVAALALLAGCNKPAAQEQNTEERPENQILLKDFAPVNVNNIPVTNVLTPKYNVIDMHSHDYAATEEEIDQWVRNMDSCHVDKAVVLHCNWIGEDFETCINKYSKYPDRFEMWCCIDYSHYGQPDFAEYANAQLDKYHAMGAKGIGELGDKGMGDLYARPVEGKGIHIDDPALCPVLAHCAELKMPVNIHVAEPYWMYLPIDATNDGLVNGGIWHVDTSDPECLDYDELMTSFEHALQMNPNTIFIACHYLNMNQDLPRLSALLDKYPNMYIDISGRLGESAQTPRATRAFLIKYQDRVLYGTDNGMELSTYRNAYRILETEDEHFYMPSFGYHWYYSAFYLPDEVLEKIYRTNAIRLMTEYK
ncbi:MAG: amidohydrolase [Paludibacteraceae bacterium]|nr:amidohydrolase [Paludibacteraceae bacterium]